MTEVGILTFHCADDYGAMLQAYGLKEYLRKRGIRAEIVRYEPPFMTGRYWWLPYIPRKNFRDALNDEWYFWIRNLKMKHYFFERKIRMNEFRKEYLLRKGQSKLFFRSQLKKLPYQYYIVGSDQIWNPDITFGLRGVYFGVFKNRNKKKVISYAASLGGSSLASEYDHEFSLLVNCVDVVSVREAAAIPYIKRFYKKDVSAVLDPVFLLKKEMWVSIEKLPDKVGYIFVYITENNDELIRYVKKLAKEKDLLIIKMGGADINGENVFADYVAGPAEFLGYIHKADYVVTNSFHGIAFSILYQKQFVAFQHSSVGERIRNILVLHELENRIYQAEETIDIDGRIRWDRVRRCTEKNVKLAEIFLEKQLD